MRQLRYSRYSIVPMSAARYMHYRDKDELLSDGLQHLNSLLNSAQPASAIPPGRSYEKIIGFSLPMFEHASGHRKLLRASLDSSAEPVVRRELQTVLTAVVGREVEKEFQSKGKTSALSSELLTHSLVSAYISMLTWWLNSRHPLPPKDMDEAYRLLILPCLASLFG